MTGRQVFVVSRHNLRWRELESFAFTSSGNDHVADAWDSRVTVPGGLDFRRFRERTRQIAIDTWAHVDGATMVWSRSAFVALRETFDRYFVVPIDDDDWLSPRLAETLRHVDPGGHDIVTWKVDLLHTRIGCRGIEDWILRRQRGMTDVISCGYALTERAFEREDARRLFFDHEVVTAAVHERGSATVEADETLSVQVRHIASSTAIRFGMGSSPVAIAEDGHDWTDLPRAQLRELYSNLLRDFGRSYEMIDHQRGSHGTSNTSTGFNDALPRCDVDSRELDDLVGVLLDEGVSTFLSIGNAFGGLEYHLARLYHEHRERCFIVGIDKSYEMYRMATAKRIRTEFPSCSVTFLPGDTHALHPMVELGRYDCVFIDGAQSADDLRHDWDLARRHTTRFVVLDHVSVELSAAERLWNEIAESGMSTRRMFHTPDLGLVVLSASDS